ncbi:hypothetical protein KEJ15_05310 [Candidatus Bathyarchaeota archaeon]|nr:hypothetical protein [Candidatus Bathyarchaeota archaeon]
MEKVEKGVKRMNSGMNRNPRTWLLMLVIPILVVVAILTAFWAASISWLPHPWERRWPPPQEVPGDVEFFYTVETVFSAINITLAIFLLLTYASIYWKTRSEFTIGLMIFSLVFLLNALVSNPLLMRVFGFRPFGLGPFALLPDVFTFVALFVLLYLSVKY